MRNVLIYVSLVTLLASTASGSTRAVQDLEKYFLHKLHRPWHVADVPSKHPRKGEYPCKDGVCKTKKPCDDCQGPAPLDVGWVKVK